MSDPEHGTGRSTAQAAAAAAAAAAATATVLYCILNTNHSVHVGVVLSRRQRMEGQVDMDGKSYSNKVYKYKCMKMKVKDKEEKIITDGCSTCFKTRQDLFEHYKRARTGVGFAFGCRRGHEPPRRMRSMEPEPQAGHQRRDADFPRAPLNVCVFEHTLCRAHSLSA